jgi:putative transposase
MDPQTSQTGLTGEIAKDCRSLIEQKCDERGWHIVELAIQPDHIHLFVRAFPDTPASEIVKECKGLTSFELRKKYPAILKKLPSMWTRSYFAATAGNVSEETIKRYIEAQKGI